MTASTDLDDIRDAAGKLPAYAWPGGYPIIYLTRDNLVLCPDCANKPVEKYDDPPVACGVHWEGAPETCEDCGAEIESAYGNPEAEATLTYTPGPGSVAGRLTGDPVWTPETGWVNG